MLCDITLDGLHIYLKRFLEDNIRGIDIAGCVKATKCLLLALQEYQGSAFAAFASVLVSRYRP